MMKLSEKIGLISVTNWLQDIIQQRISPEISLHVKDGMWKLFIAGSEHGIFIVCNWKKWIQGIEPTYYEWDCSQEGFDVVVDSNIPAPSYQELPGILIHENSNYVDYDFLSFIWWVLSRREEIDKSIRDEHERFSAVASHAYQHGYLMRPVVDEWIEILCQIVKRVWPSLIVKKHQFTLTVTHDVDSPSLYAFKSWPMVMRMMAGHLIKRRDILSCCYAPYIKATTRTQLHPADPFNTFNWLMDISEKNGIQSAFYFMCGKTFAKYDPDYSLEHPSIRNLLREIHDRGHEIGLHPSYGTYEQPELLVREAEQLKRVCAEENINQAGWGGRMHYLRWKQPATLYAWEQAGMAYDATLGYADHPGFRCGTCHEYPAFDPVALKALQLCIRPLIVMDCTIMGSNYLGLSIENAGKTFSSLTRACKSVNGNLVLLWHNSYLNSPATQNFYSELIALGSN